MREKAEYGNWVSKRIIYLSIYLSIWFFGVRIFGFISYGLGLDNSCCAVSSNFGVFSVCSVPIFSSRGKYAKPYLDVGVSKFRLEWRGKGT